MIYSTKRDFLDAPQKRIAFIGMSGLGKTYISTLLRASGDWFHYYVDYRIGTRYMGEPIVDNFKREAMKVPFLRMMLMSDSISIGSNITFENLAPLSTYLGKPGDPGKGGIAFDEYMRRQAFHREAEIAATKDTAAFIDKARDIYGYNNFVSDTSGSICEVVDPEDRADPVLTTLADNLLIVWIRGADSHIETLVDRFNKAPKPMYARPDAMQSRWQTYLHETSAAPEAVDPDAFVRWSYRKILDDRLPLYRSIADNWGVTIDADHLANARDEADVIAALASVLPDR